MAAVGSNAHASVMRRQKTCLLWGAAIRHYPCRMERTRAAMKIGILGPMEVRTETDELLLPRGGKQRLLLAVLLLHAPRVVSADRLADCLWGDSSPANPLAALRTQLSRLRSFMESTGGGEDAIRSESHGYRLDLEGIEVDAEVFERRLRESRSAEDPETEARLLTSALALWRGEAYEEFADVPVFLATMRSLTELRMGARERRVECHLALGRMGDALAEAESLVHADPLRERPRALLMQSLYRSGRQHEALAIYQEFRRLLSDELGLDPSPALRQLEGAILRHEASQTERIPGDRRKESGRNARGAPVPKSPVPESPVPEFPVPGSAVPESPVSVSKEERRGRPPRSPVPEQDIRFCRSSDGVRLAFATMGSGPPLVKAANWLNHLEFDWESPVWRGLFRALATDHLLVRYDERGSGLSDWDPPEISLESWVLDLETVVEASGLDRFPLLGISQGVAVCIEYAARHPERVTGLILHGGYAAGWRADSSYTQAEVARRDASIQIIRHGWGEDTPAYRQMFTQTFIPGGTAAEIDWFNELERRSTSPDNAARFMEAFAQIDVRDRLPLVQAPTLILHARGDQRIHYDRGRELATAIPRARFVLLESNNHLILEHEDAFDQWLREAGRFLAEELDP